MAYYAELYRQKGELRATGEIAKGYVPWTPKY
jgi:hypothetical protein